MSREDQFKLARAYNVHGMYAYSQLQQQEFADEQYGSSAVKEQFVA